MALPQRPIKIIEKAAGIRRGAEGNIIIPPKRIVKNIVNKNDRIKR